MAKIKFINGGFHYDGTDKMIFEKLNLELDTKWKSGVIARNGRGKTTLLQLIQGQIKLTQGTLIKEIETVLFPIKIKDPEQNVLTLMKEYTGPFLECEQIMETFTKNQVIEAVYYEALMNYIELGGYELVAKIKRECHRLKLKDQVLTQSYASLSGGEQTKIQIIMMFLKPKTFILLDEPTNYLDGEGIKCLSHYLAQKDGFLLVSHHRAFLNDCCDHMIALEKSEVIVMQGSYQAYENDYKLRKDYENKQRTKAEQEVVRLQKVVQERRNWSNTKEKEKIGAGDKGFVSHRAAKLMKRALAVEKRMTDHLEEKKELVKYREHVPYLKIKQVTNIKELLWVSHLALGYGNHPVLTNLNFSLNVGERLAICGPNGSGKTSLIKVLSGELEPLAGIVKIDSRLKIAHVSQIPRYQSGYLRQILETDQVLESHFRSLLGALSCHRDIFERDLSTFSLGELKKVDLAFSLYHESHLLIWDEPLNGLDILTRRAIEEAVVSCNPTMIFIEHDQAFIDRVATKRLYLGSNNSELK